MTTTKMTIRKTLLTLTAATLLLPAAALASDATPNHNLAVKTTTDYHVKQSAKSFKKGEFERSARYATKAINSSMSDKRKAIAFTNLCAANAAMGDMTAAKEACDEALVLRPGYAPAENNKAALTIMLAQK